MPGHHLISKGTKMNNKRVPPLKACSLRWQKFREEISVSSEYTENMLRKLRCFNQIWSLSPPS